MAKPIVAIVGRPNVGLSLIHIFWAGWTCLLIMTRKSAPVSRKQPKRSVKIPMCCWSPVSAAPTWVPALWSVSYTHLREGTAAYDFPGQVPEHEKESRSCSLAAGVGEHVYLQKLHPGHESHARCV